MKRLLDGSLPGCPDLWFGVVDVRDVADLHLRAMTDPGARGERFLATSEDFVSVRQIADILREGVGDAVRSVPTRPVPTWLMRVVGLFDPQVRGVLPELGKRNNATNEKARRLLGWVPKSPREAVLATALQLARHGTVVLVGRDRKKLEDLRKLIDRKGQHAMSIVCDLSDVASARNAAREIAALRLPVVGLINNAGIMQTRPTKNARGWDMSFATNHLGPFALTDTLSPHLPDSANVVFVVSAVEDPERKPAVAAGFRGGRYISAEASARGEWKAGGSKRSAFDAYATSQQACLAAALALARETPRLRFNAVEPGFNPTTRLGDVNVFIRFLILLLVPAARQILSDLRDVATNI